MNNYIKEKRKERNSVLLLTYDIANTKLPHHNKILKKLNTLFNSLHPELKNTNPIISGSYAINLLFKPTATYKDIDFYFESEQDFIKAADCFSQWEAEKVTANKNCVIYEKQGFQYQLIIRNFTSPENLIKDHDFFNSAIAIQNDKIFLLSNLINLYDNDLLEFQNIVFYNQKTPQDQISAFSTFFNRILKYMDRYDFDLSENALKDCIKIEKWIDEKLKNPDYVTVTAKTNMYYDMSYSETNTYEVSFKDLAEKFKTFLKKYQNNLLEELPNEIIML